MSVLKYHLIQYYIYDILNYENVFYFYQSNMRRDILKIGDKIRLLRTKSGITIEELCEDETHLSVRQLGRIERNKSNPTFSKLVYISKKLRIPLYKIMPDYNTISTDYINCKNELLKISSYGNPVKIKQIETIINRIYKGQYVNLPHDEKIVFETLVDLVKLSNNNYKKIFSLLTPYIEEIKRKQFFIINDLIIIKYILIYILKNNHYSHHNDFKKIAEILLSEEQKNSISFTDFDLFRDVLFLILHISFYYGDLQLIHRINKKLEAELFYFEDTKKIPLYYLFKWKECLLIKNQKKHC